MKKFYIVALLLFPIFLSAADDSRSKEDKKILAQTFGSLIVNWNNTESEEDFEKIWHKTFSFPDKKNCTHHNEKKYSVEERNKLLRKKEKQLFDKHFAKLQIERQQFVNAFIVLPDQERKKRATKGIMIDPKTEQVWSELKSIDLEEIDHFEKVFKLLGYNLNK